MADIVVADVRPEDKGDGEHVADPGTLSPSQIDIWHDCERKWAFIYIGHLRPKGTGSAALGGLIHGQAENYLHGKPLDFTVPGHAADILSSGLEHLPSPAPWLEIEKAFKFRAEKSGIWYRGRVDLAIPPERRPEYVPLIHDHKSTKSIQRWAKTPKVLETDSQAIIYGKSAFLRWPEAKYVDLQWLYMQTEGPRESKLVQLRRSRDQISEQFERIDLDGRKMIAMLGSGVQPLDVPPRVSACRAYGGCPFLNRECKLSPKEFLASTMMSAIEKQQETSTMDFLGSLLNSSATTTTNAPVPTSVPTAAASAPTYAPGCEPPAGDATTSPFFKNLPPATTQLPLLPTSDQPINPPEFQPPPPSGVAAVAAAELAAAAVATSAPATEKKPRRGRPPGSKNSKNTGVFTPTVPVAPIVTATSVDVPERQLSLEVSVPTATTTPVEFLRNTEESFTLYLDCLPIANGSYVFAETYIAQAVKELQEKVPGAHGWRVGEPVAYGKGAELLSIRVSEIAKEKNRNVVLDTRTPEGAACKSALMALTQSVVMGFR